MDKKEKKTARLKYWVILLNPVFLALYFFALQNLSALLQWGGVRRRMPNILLPTAIGVLWFIFWTFLYLYRKRAGLVKISIKKWLWALILVLEILFLVGASVFYTQTIYQSSHLFQGALGRLIWQRQTQREITLVHNNLYEDGINGIFEDLGQVLDLPPELYLVNSFSLDFDEEGTITRIYSFFRGRDGSGADRTFLLNYDGGRSDKMTVSLDGSAGTIPYADTLKMDPMFQLMEKVDTREQVQELTIWSSLYGTGYGLLYYGHRDFPSSDGIVGIRADGTIDETFSSEHRGGVNGYIVSLFIKDADNVPPIRLLNTWDRPTDGSEIPEKSPNVVGTPTKDTSGTFLSLFITQDQGWQFTVVDAAAGSRWYAFEETQDGGETWNRINDNAFGEFGGVAADMVMFDDQFGYAVLGSPSGQYSRLYVTRDGGVNFQQVFLPVEEIPQAGEDQQSLGYINLPYFEGDLLMVATSQESGGGRGFLFQSEDNGEGWVYMGMTEP